MHADPGAPKQVPVFISGDYVLTHIVQKLYYVLSTKTILHRNTFIQLPQKFAIFFQIGGFGLWPLANITQLLKR